MKLNKRTLFHHKIFIVFADNIGLGSVIISRRNFGVESKIKLNLLEGHLLRKKYLGRHSTSVPIFLKLDFFKMTDFCYESMVSEGLSKDQIRTFYISLVGELIENNFYKRMHAESHYFQYYLRKTISDNAIIVK